MFYTTSLSCISNLGTPSSHTKGKASIKWPIPPFIKASAKSPLFKECHLRGSYKRWSWLCAVAGPPALIPNNFSAPVVPVIKEAWTFKWAGSPVALSSYHIGLQSGLQWTLIWSKALSFAGLTASTSLQFSSSPSLFPPVYFLTDKTTNGTRDWVVHCPPPPPQVKSFLPFAVL